MSEVLASVSKQKRKNNIELEYIQSQKVWKKKWLVIMFFISKFISIAKLTKRLFRPFLLTAFQLKLIGDITSDQEQKQQSEKYDFHRMLSYTKFNRLLTYKTFKKIKKKAWQYFSFVPNLLLKISSTYNKVVERIFDFIPLINYLSSFYNFWEAIIFICSFLNFVYLPFEFSFEYERVDFFKIHISTICPIIYSVDIFIRANTQTFQQGSHYQQHIQILKEYLTSSFISDIISLLSLNQEFFTFKGIYFLFFLRIFRSLRILDIFREQFFSRTQISGIISLILLFASSICYGHIFACIWYYVGKQSDTGWINFYNLDGSDLYTNYIYSFYFSVVTMTTIGFGDIVPKTTTERLVLIFMMFISCGVFGYTINSIGNILSDFKQKSDRYLTELAQLNKYFKQYEVSLYLQGNARRYLKFIHEEGTQDKLSTLSSLSNLSEYLQNQIKMDVISRKLKQIAFFKENLKEEAFFQLSLLVQEKIFQPDQIILDQNEIKEPAIYLINHGVVVKYSQFDITARENSIMELKEKDCFGIYEFFVNKENSEFNYKSKGLTSIYMLNISSFIKVIKQDNDSYEKFCFLKDQIIYQQTLNKIKLACESCKSRNHNLKECPCIFYKSRNITIVKRYLQSEKENHQQINRKHKLKQNSLAQYQKNYKKNMEFQYDNLHQLSIYDQSNASEDDYQIGTSTNIYRQRNNDDPREIRRSQKTSEYPQEECYMSSDAEKNIDIKSSLVVPRRRYHFEKQKTEDSKRQNSTNQIDEDDSIKQLQIPSVSKKSFQSFPSIIPGMNNQRSDYTKFPSMNNKNLLQGILQHMNDIQSFITTNYGTSKKLLPPQQMVNQALIKSPRQLELTPQSHYRKEQHLNLNNSVNTQKENLQQQFIRQSTKYEQDKYTIYSHSVDYINQEFDRMSIYKIYYPNHNFDKIIQKVNQSMNVFQIPQTLKRLRLRKKNFRHSTKKLALIQN